MSSSNTFIMKIRIVVKSVLTAVLTGLALGASVTTAGADVVAGTEDGWGKPPGGVTLSVVDDDGSGNHLLTVTWGSIDPIPADGGYWQCEVDERSTPSNQSASQLNTFVNVRLDPPSGGFFQKKVAAAPGQRLNMNIQCSTLYPSAFATTPPGAPFGWKFQYQLS